MLPRFARFALVGGFATAVQYAILICLVEWASVPAVWASTLGYIASSAVNYFLNYTFTFHSAAPHLRSVPRFVLIGAVGVVLNGGVTYVGTAICGMHYLAAQVVATAITLLWNFSANLRWTF
jgi:putative flippase GtrA